MLLLGIRVRVKGRLFCKVFRGKEWVVKDYWLVCFCFVSCYGFCLNNIVVGWCLGFKLRWICFFFFWRVNCNFCGFFFVLFFKWEVNLNFFNCKWFIVNCFCYKGCLLELVIFFLKFKFFVNGVFGGVGIILVRGNLVVFIWRFIVLIVVWKLKLVLILVMVICRFFWVFKFLLWSWFNLSWEFC